jgi:hypothetical protein
MIARFVRRSRRAAALTLAVLLGGLVSVAAPPSGGAQEACYFTLGFKALRDQIADRVGQCLENERFNLENGNAEQRTSGGLLVWRKADNWTAFTDGRTTWINGPQGLVSRPNAGPLFPWEAAAPPAASPPPGPAPAPPPPPPPPPPPSAAPAPRSESGPIQKDPQEIILGLNDVGKEIYQSAANRGTADRASWAEARFERGREAANQQLGPLNVYSKAHVAENVEAARAIYNKELDQQRRMPEAKNRKEGSFRPEGVVRVGEEQDALSMCNYDCGGSAKFDSLHQRAVFRHQNVVVVLYFYGPKDESDVDQLNEWLPKLRERIE